ncbi:hypothetical protein HZS_1691 [Henneguya salminicola]|nr:hypothetical protein HZS_1691 [Henneguya salminicola]
MPKTRIYPPRGSSQLPNTRELSADSDEEFLNVYSSLDSLEESDNDIKSIILDQLRKYRHVSVRIKKNSKGDGRFAVLQFDNTDALNYFKRAILEKRDRIIVYDKVLFFNFNHANRRLPATERISDRISHRDQRNYSPERSYSRSNRYDRSSENDRRPPIAVSRTLFVGNLDDNIETAEIRRVFEPYGELLEVVIKHPHAARSAPYAFVKYRKLSATINAREQLQDTYVGRKRLKIGFGKVSPSHALWVGGLNDNTNEEELLTEVKRHSRFADYEIRNDNHIAYFVFETIDDSRRAYNGLQNIKLVHSGAKLEVDYADTHVEAKDLMDKIRVKDNRRASRSSTRSLEDVSDRSRSPVNSQIRVNRKRHGSYSSSSYSSRRRSPNGVSRRSRSKECRSLENHEDTEIKSMELHKIDDGHKESVKRDSMISSPSNRHKSFKSGSNFSGDDYKDVKYEFNV